MPTASAEFDPKDAVASFGATWRAVLFQPRAFFEGLPEGGGMQPPFLFALICLAIGGFGFMIFGAGIKGFFAVLTIGIVRLFVGSAIVALIAQQLFEGRGDYEATFRVLCYASAVAVVIGIPVIKHFAALYGIYLVIIGLARAHSFDTVRATLSAVASVFVGWVIVHALCLGGWMHRANPLFH